MRIVISGVGVVGTAFVEQWLKQKPGAQIVSVIDETGAFTQQEGITVEDLEKLVLEKKQGKKIAEIFQAEQKFAKEVIRESKPGVLVELTPSNFETGEPALSNILYALESKCSVVTSTKSHTRTPEDNVKVLQTAKENGVCFYDDASVMGGVPITEAMTGISSELVEAKGVLNGSTNFILTKMEEGTSFEDAVSLARERGFLEKDASNDLEGHDPASKLCALSARFGYSLLKSQVELNEYNGEKGILGVSKEKIEELKKHGKTIRLVASLSRNGAGIQASVQAQEVSVADGLGQTKGPLNALSLKLKANNTEYELFFRGPGAGGDVTAARVLAGVKRILNQ